MAFGNEPFRIFWRYPSDEGTFSDPGVVANYPLNNLKIDTLDKRWRSEPDSGGAVQVTVDLGSAQEVSAFALLNHNLESGDTITLRYADDSGFSVGVGTISPTYHEDTLIEYFPAVTKRYWRLELVVNTSATVEVEAGRLLLGPHYQMTRNVTGGFSGPALTDDTSRSTRTRGGQRYSDEGERLRTFRGTFPPLPQVDFEEMEALRRINGRARSFIISQLWEDYPVKRTLYGALDGLGSSSNVSGREDDWGMSIQMTEQK